MIIPAAPLTTADGEEPGHIGFPHITQVGRDQERLSRDLDYDFKDLSKRPPGRKVHSAALGLRERYPATARLGRRMGHRVRDAADLQLRLALLRIGEVAEFDMSRPGDIDVAITLV
jgi:hypothetical protein